MFLLDQDDGLYRLSSAKFNQMLRDPTSCRLTRFAGARVRMTNVAVELLDRQPIRVVWNTFGFLAFDDVKSRPTRATESRRNGASRRCGFTGFGQVSF
jgi:hypothetical protein